MIDSSQNENFTLIIIFVATHRPFEFTLAILEWILYLKPPCHSSVHDFVVCVIFLREPYSNHQKFNVFVCWTFIFMINDFGYIEHEHFALLWEFIMRKEDTLNSQSTRWAIIFYVVIWNIRCVWVLLLILFLFLVDRSLCFFFSFIAISLSDENNFSALYWFVIQSYTHWEIHRLQGKLHTKWNCKTEICMEIRSIIEIVIAKSTKIFNITSETT